MRPRKQQSSSGETLLADAYLSVLGVGLLACLFLFGAAVGHDRAAGEMRGDLVNRGMARYVLDHSTNPPRVKLQMTHQRTPGEK